MTVDLGPRTSIRHRSHDDYRQCRPVHAVWEITLACNLKCKHCGSRAGKRREQELSTQECLDIVEDLSDLGVREISLIGGEAYLRKDWLEIVEAIARHGIRCGLQTGGRGLTHETVRRAAGAGLLSAGVSIDGLPDLHDELRGVPGSYAQAMAALGYFHENGLTGSVNTQITSRVLPQLRPLMHEVIRSGAKAWQIQLTVAMGKAADNDDLLLQPYQVLEFMPLLMALHEEAEQAGLTITPGNNVGYFGPYESRLRTMTDAVHHWQGCTAGQTTIGIEADGTIKGCPSLPTDDFRAGYAPRESLKQLWNDASQLKITRNAWRHDLWGFCATCYYKDVCRSGCTWTSQVLFGRSGNNPYCHFRALQLQERGLRERVVKDVEASGKPFDHGLFHIVLETFDGDQIDIAYPPVHSSADNGAGDHPRTPQSLELCEECKQYVYEGTEECPFCGCNVPLAREIMREVEPECVDEVTALIARLESMMTNIPKV